MFRRRFRSADYVIFGLAALGFLWKLIYNPLPYLLIAALIAGLLYYERRLSGRSRSRFRAANRFSAPVKPKRKPSPFRIIPGTKGLSNEEPPKYH